MFWGKNGGWKLGRVIDCDEKITKCNMTASVKSFIKKLKSLLLPLKYAALLHFTVAV